MQELKYAMFDGVRVWDGACVTIDGDKIVSVAECSPEECGDGFLMPGLIDAHTHMGSMAEADRMVRAGIAATCDVDGVQSLIESSRQLRIVSSAGMIMGIVLNPRATVDKFAAAGAEYIKVLLFSPHSVGERALRGIVSAAHDKGLKVIVHATMIETVRQAVEAGADVLLHTPMKEEYPPELAEKIAAQGIAVVPTLIMMETFSLSGRNGYKPEHYPNAEAAVDLLHKTGVEILTGTDANPGGFAPAVDFGPSMHREMELLVKAGLSPVEVLASATARNAELFGISDLGTIAAGKRADLVLVSGRPDRDITDIANIKQIWNNGQPI